MSRRALLCVVRSVANSCFYYLGRKSKLSFHNEIPPSSLARDAPLISFSPKHVLLVPSSSWVVEVAEVEERAARRRWWRNGQERGASEEALPLPPSFSVPLSAHRAAQQEGGRDGAAESSPISPSLHSFSRSVCMIRATCRRPSHSLAHWGMMPSEFKCAFGSGHPVTAAASMSVMMKSVLV